MLRAVPTNLREVNDFIRRHHRHLGPAAGCKFVVGIADGDRLCGVATVGRPTSRIRDDGWTVQVTRLATDGTPNASSKLLGLCRRVAFILGYQRVLTYTMPEESGASCRAVGLSEPKQTEGGSWSRPSRKRRDQHPTGPKLRWEDEK